MPRNLLPRVVFLGLFAISIAEANSKKNLAPHVHGEGQLRFVAESEKGEIELSIQIPAIQVLGFEHKPKTAEEKKTHTEAHLKLKDHKQVFSIVSTKKGKADCVFNHAVLKSPYMGDHDHGHLHHAHDHADYELTYRMKCRDIKAVQSFQVVAFQNLKGLTKLKVEGLVDGRAVTKELTAADSNIPVN